MIKQNALLRMKDLNPGLLTATGVLLSVAFRIKNKVIDGDDHVLTMSQRFELMKRLDKVDESNVLTDKQVN